MRQTIDEHLFEKVVDVEHLFGHAVWRTANTCSSNECSSSRLPPPGGSSPSTRDTTSSIAPGQPGKPDPRGTFEAPAERGSAPGTDQCSAHGGDEVRSRLLWMYPHPRFSHTPCVGSHFGDCHTPSEDCTHGRCCSHSVHHRSPPPGPDLSQVDVIGRRCIPPAGARRRWCTHLRFPEREVADPGRPYPGRGRFFPRRGPALG